jgi:undecaprenyl diphosphate synthase
MGLFMTALEQQVRKLHEHNIRLRIIGDRSAFSSMLQERIEAAERLTESNSGLNLVIAANYGGRWDMTQAARVIANRVQARELTPAEVTPELLQSLMSLSDVPEPDLFIRTGGEKRVSNFLLWHLAYTELYFTDTLWPDFDRQAFEGALASFETRQRRFGRTGDQIATAQSV